MRSSAGVGDGLLTVDAVAATGCTTVELDITTAGEIETCTANNGVVGAASVVFNVSNSNALTDVEWCWVGHRD